MLIHLPIKNENRPNSRTATPRKKDPGDNSWRDDLFCSWKQGLSWGKKLSEKGSVKQTTSGITSGWHGWTISMGPKRRKGKGMQIKTDGSIGYVIYEIFTHCNTFLTCHMFSL